MGPTLDDDRVGIERVQPIDQSKQERYARDPSDDGRGLVPDLDQPIREVGKGDGDDRDAHGDRRLPPHREGRHALAVADGSRAGLDASGRWPCGGRRSGCVCRPCGRPRFLGILVGRVEDRVLAPAVRDIDLAQDRNDELFVVRPVRSMVVQEAAAVPDLAAPDGVGPRQLADFVEQKRTVGGRVVGPPEVAPAKTALGPRDVLTKPIRHPRAVGRVARRQSKGEIPALTERDQLVDLDVGQGRVGQRQETDHDTAGVGDDDHPPATLRPQRADRPGEPAADVCRLGRIVEKDPDVPEPARQEGVE